jgi:hypothetical protein
MTTAAKGAPAACALTVLATTKKEAVPSSASFDAPRGHVVMKFMIGIPPVLHN